METASLYGILKTLFYILAFYYIFRFLAKLFLPILVKKAVQKAGQNFQQQQYRQYQRFNEQDNVTVDTSKAPRSRDQKKVGEYVDYEEIE